VTAAVPQAALGAPAAESLTVSVCAPLAVAPTAAVEQIADAVAGVDVRFEPSLLPEQRFPADHCGADDFARDPAGEGAWRRMLADTDIALGIPGDSADGLRCLVDLAPRLRWVQGTAAGMGEQVARACLPADVLARVTFTSAAGLHAVPLAEFALFGLLTFAKDADVLAAAGQARQWLPRWPMRRLRGSSVLVLGLGGVGREVARLCSAFGCRVIGVRRRVDGPVPDGVETVASLADLDRLLPSADAVVVTLPGTAETAGLLDGRRLALLPPHAVVVNVGRGSVIDSVALAARLEARALRGAVLDVADQEPLPLDSPLWGRPDIVISPHTAALTVDEDDRIVELFTDNLRRFLAGTPLRNVVDPVAGY
jgi:glyoxylate/hydroxypyruvate reductase A